jgi:hypothetical protein
MSNTTLIIYVACYHTNTLRSTKVEIAKKQKLKLSTQKNVFRRSLNSPHPYI